MFVTVAAAISVDVKDLLIDIHLMMASGHNVVITKTNMKTIVRV